MKLSSISSIYSGSSESSKIDNNVVEITGLLVVVTVGTGALVVVENCVNLLVLNLSDRAPGNSFWGTILRPPLFLLLLAKIFDLTLGPDPGGLEKGKLGLIFSLAGSTVGAGSKGRLVGIKSNADSVVTAG